MNFKIVDLYLVLPVVFLTMLGLVVQYSIANKVSGVSLDVNIASQIAAVVIGATTGLVMYKTQLYKMKWFSFIFYIVSLVLLILVLTSGVQSNGSQRWVTILGFQFQPTELVKFGLILVLARLFDTKEVTVNRLRTILLSIVVIAIPSGLIMLQP